MKTRSSKIIRNTVFGIAIIMMMIVFGACSKKIVFLGSSVVPAAEGHVKVKKDGNENYAISLNISNLAEVDKMQPPKNMYVIWMETDEGLTKNIGQIISSQNLNAKFETVSSSKPVMIYLTAEDTEDIQRPGKVVLTTARF